MTLKWIILRGQCEKIEIVSLTTPADFLQGHSILGTLYQSTEEHGDQLFHVISRGSAQGKISFQCEQTHSLARHLTLPKKHILKLMAYSSELSLFLLNHKEAPLPYAVDCSDFWEGEFQQPLLSLIQERDTGPVNSHNEPAP